MGSPDIKRLRQLSKSTRDNFKAEKEAQELAEKEQDEKDRKSPATKKQQNAALKALLAKANDAAVKYGTNSITVDLEYMSIDMRFMDDFVELVRNQGFNCSIIETRKRDMCDDLEDIHELTIHW